MTVEGKQDARVHLVDAQAAKKGKSRVKPRHLSPLLRRCIVEQFCACVSSEDLAEELGIPVRTISDVLIAEALRRPIQPERGAAMPVLMRRTA